MDELKLWQKILIQTAIWVIKTFVMKKLSTELKDLLKKGVSLAEDIAVKTKNPIDDQVVKYLKDLLN